MSETVVVVCGECGSSEWKHHERMTRVTGQVGGVREEITVAKCKHCGHRQAVE